MGLHLDNETFAPLSWTEDEVPMKYLDDVNSVTWSTENMNRQYLNDINTVTLIKS